MIKWKAIKIQSAPKLERESGHISRVGHTRAHSVSFTHKCYWISPSVCIVSTDLKGKKIKSAFLIKLFIKIAYLEVFLPDISWDVTLLLTPTHPFAIPPASLTLFTKSLNLSFSFLAFGFAWPVSINHRVKINVSFDHDDPGKQHQAVSL